MLVVFDNVHSINYIMSSNIDPLGYPGDIVIAMDPSKTNFAMVVGTPEGEVIQIVEFSGNNRGRGPAQDTTVYCQELKQFLSQYFMGANLYVAGIEAAITPHKKGKPNYAFHVANMALTEIRGTVLAFFMEEYHIHITEVNNWSWKASELPEGYRGRDQKYSKKYLIDTDPTNSLISYFQADACDAYFIFKHLVRTSCSSYIMICNQVEQPTRDYSMSIVQKGMLFEDGLREVQYNNMFSIEENATFYANRLSTNFFFYAPIKDLTLEQIYKYTQYTGFDIMKEVEAVIIVENIDSDA